ncbi:MAG: glycosyltransferase family 4 protein [Solirubrobacteraceae bacterium]
MLLHKSLEFDSRVRREAGALAAAGHRVVVLELAAVAPDAGSIDGVERRSVLPPARLRGWLPFHLYRLAFLLAFLRAILGMRPDAIHAHDAAMLLPGLIGARLTRARLIYDSHELAAGVPYREPLWAGVVRSLERVVVPRCDAVITVSDGIADRLRATYRLLDRPTVLRNVSALRREGNGGLRAGLGISQATPLVLHQGAPAPYRGCDVLVDAVARLDGVCLAFLGDPEPGYGETLRARIVALGLSDRVRMLPSVPLPDLLDHTAEADVGVTLLQDTCENHRLALPNKLFEYVAAGVPIVASELPEIRRLIEAYGIGWCAAPADPGAVADALRVALRHRGDPELKARIASAAAELTWSGEQRQLLDLYDRLAQRGGAKCQRAYAAPCPVIRGR